MLHILLALINAATELHNFSCRNGSVTLHIYIIKDAGLRSMRVKYKEENSL